MCVCVHSPCERQHLAAKSVKNDGLNGAPYHLIFLPAIQATCERGFAAMEESHQKVIDELQRKHQRELENLQEEKERLLAEETAATIAGESS